MAAGPDFQAQLRLAQAHVDQAPKDAKARLILAELLLRADRRPEMYQHIEHAMRNAPARWSGQEELGALLFRAGELKAAAQVLDQAILSGKIGGEGLRIRSALYTHNGEPDPARRTIGAAALVDPLATAEPQTVHLPQVLRVRCVDRSRYTISRNRQTGLWARRMRSGHFSMRDLLDHRFVGLSTLTTFGDSILSIAPPPTDLIINTIACADLNEGPLRHLAAWLARQPTQTVINAPDRVLETTRAKTAERLRNIPKVITPKTDRLINDCAPDDMVARLERLGHRFPLILRRAGTQTGISVVLARDADATAAYFEHAGQGAELYAIAYHDMRDSAGHYRKTRAFFIDGVFYPVANLVSDHWQIHSGDRYRIMSDMADAQARERAYLSDPADYLGLPAWRALHAIRDAVVLDFFGIDFTLTEKGEVFVFEANAAMRHNYDHVTRFPYTHPHLDRIGRAFTSMVLTRVRAQQNAAGAGKQTSIH